jgi:hypothetical protein
MPQHSDQVTTSILLSGHCLQTRHRHCLQTRQSNESNEPQTVYLAAVEKFNDSRLSSGGLVSDHPALLNQRINPEAINPGHLLTVLEAQNAVKDLIVKYSEMSQNMARSGTHQSDPWEYCHGDTDLLYIHLWLQKHDTHPHLQAVQQFRSEGNETPLTSSESGILLSPSPLSVKKRKRREEIDLLSLSRENNVLRQREYESFIAAFTAQRVAALAQARLSHFDIMTNAADRLRKMEGDGRSETQEYRLAAGVYQKALEIMVELSSIDLAFSHEEAFSISERLYSFSLSHDDASLKYLRETVGDE